jgi:hypothetical protein
LRKHEAENMVLEELTVGGHRLYTHFFIMYTYIAGNRQSVRQCIVNHVENDVLYTAVLLVAGRQPAKAVN